MKKQKWKEGDIFELSEIELHGEKIALAQQKRLAKVIFKSKKTRLMIAIIVSKQIFDDLPSDVENLIFSDKVYYTGCQLLNSGDWQVIGNQKVSEEEQQLTQRLVGNSLCVLDEDLGVVPQNERKKYPKQLISGVEALYYHIDVDFQ